MSAMPAGDPCDFHWRVWMPHPPASQCAMMVMLSIVDLAKQVLQVHGAISGGHVLFRKKLSRSQVSQTHDVVAIV